ncbi:MAG: RHS repeat-associated core domain-containing protein, partial [Treponema sp.]|nr:RHS repeat-associated core domain-containing protein [Treponema sp.]
ETWVEKTSPEANLNFLPYKFTAKEMDEETGLYYYGARYLDPKYSRWISTDPALGDYVPQAPINDEAKKHNQNLPGMGGVFNTVNLSLYHYAANNPLHYTDPTGLFDCLEDSQTGFLLWFNAAMDPQNIDTLNSVSDFMNTNPEFWGVLGGTGAILGTGYGIYSLCPPIKSFVDGCCDWARGFNNDLLSNGFDISDISYNYNNNDITKFTISFKDSSLSNLKTNMLFERVLHKNNEERGNIISFDSKFNVSTCKNENYLDFTITLSFNAKYREKKYEEIVSDIRF